MERLRILYVGHSLLLLRHAAITKIAKNKAKHKIKSKLILEHALRKCYYNDESIVLQLLFIYAFLAVTQKLFVYFRMLRFKEAFFFSFIFFMLFLKIDISLIFFHLFLFFLLGFKFLICKILLIFFLALFFRRNICFGVHKYLVCWSGNNI